MLMLRLLLPTTALFAFASVVLAQVPAQAPGQRGTGGADRTTDTAITDEMFVMMAPAADMAEIMMGKMGAEQATNPSVKRYAQQLVDDHTKSSKALMALADKKGFAPAKAVSDHHRMESERMAKLQGANFDQAFAKHMVADHRKAVELYTAEARSGKDQDLRAFAEKSLPILREHLKMAESLAGAGGTRGTGTATRTGTQRQQ